MAATISSFVSFRLFDATFFLRHWLASPTFVESKIASVEFSLELSLDSLQTTRKSSKRWLKRFLSWDYLFLVTIDRHVDEWLSEILGLKKIDQRDSDSARGVISIVDVLLRNGQKRELQFVESTSCARKSRTFFAIFSQASSILKYNPGKTDNKFITS